MNDTLLHLATTFSKLSLLSVGGGTAVLPEMETILEEQFHITRTQFVHVYGIGQLAPGPNMLMVLIFGYHLASILGAAVVFLAFFLPSSALCLLVWRLWGRIGESPWRRSVQNALEPVSIGLMASGVYAVGKAALRGPTTVTLALTTLVLILGTRLNPVIVILGLGGIGAAIMLSFPIR